MRRHILSLTSREAQNPRLAGGKAAGLARLSGLGFPVPAGFVISIPALSSHCRHLFGPFQPGIGNITPQQLDEIRERILAAPIPASLQDAVQSACRHHPGPWAVRSSMRGEDSPRSSFAGLLDTYLNVSDFPSVIEAVRKCLASLCNWRLWNYQLETGQSWKTTRKMMALAVLVQEMIKAQVSGVAFGADPNTGRKDVIIEAVRGTGEKLVQGRVTPHRYVLDDQGNLEYLPPQDGDSPCLQEKDVLRLAGAVRDISARTGSPQDIEWAFDGRDFRFLQCRPITALPTQRVYSSRLVSEMSPGLIKPLMWSTKTRSMVRTVFGRISTELIGPNQVDFAKYIKRIHSRIYADMTAFGEFLERLGLPPNFFEMITRQEKRPHRAGLFRNIKLSKLPPLLSFAWRYSRSAKEIAGFIETHDRKLERFRRAAWDTFPPAKLLDMFDELLQLHAKTQWYIFIGPMNMTIRYRLLNRFLARRAPGVSPGELLMGIDGLKALEPNALLMEIGRMALDLKPETRELMLAGAASALQIKLSEEEAGRKLLSRFHDFMKRFGFLSANGSDFTVTPWIEDPSPIWKSIARLAQQFTSGIALGHSPLRRESFVQVRRRLNVLQRLVFDRLVRSTRQYVKLRESSSLIMSEETYLMRRALMQLGEILEGKGAIDGAADVFFLYYDELREWLTGNLQAGEAGRRIALRKAELERDAEIDVPDTFQGEAGLYGPKVSEQTECLNGISGSPGRAHGIARVILDPARPPAPLTSENILVAPYTDVGWTPLLPGIRGIVAETGGQLSHTSIIAREYGLPAVVNVKEATRLISNGELITIDGTLGRVYRHGRTRIRPAGGES
jgi:phosphohistidine swiveling domain-containing protein